MCPGKGSRRMAAPSARDRLEYSGPISHLPATVPQFHRPLVHLDDHAVLIKEKRCGKGEVTAAVEQVAINNVVDAGDVGCGEQRGEENPSWATKAFTACASRGSSTLMPRMRRPLDARADRLAEKPHLLSAGRRSGGPEVKQDEGCRGTIAGPMTFPARSGKEKSGALKGSISQVSTDDGKVSSF